MARLLTRIEAAREWGRGLRTIDRWSSVGLRGVVLVRTYRGGRVFYDATALVRFQAEVDVSRRRPAGVRTRKGQKKAAERVLAGHGLG